MSKISHYTLTMRGRRGTIQEVEICRKVVVSYTTKEDVFSLIVSNLFKVIADTNGFVLLIKAPDFRLSLLDVITL